MKKTRIDQHFLLTPLILLLFVLTCWKVSADTLTMTAYFPAPTGNYQDLTIAHNAGIGTAVVNNNLTVANNVGIGTTDLTRASLWVNGNVMIGTTTGTKLLQVYGNVGVGNDLTVANNVGIGTQVTYRDLQVKGNVSVGTTLVVPNWINPLPAAPAGWPAFYQWDSKNYAFYVAGNTILGSGSPEKTYISDSLIVKNNIEMWNGTLMFRPIDPVVDAPVPDREGTIYVSKGTPNRLLMYLNGRWQVILTRDCTPCVAPFATDEEAGYSCPLRCTPTE